MGPVESRLKNSATVLVLILVIGGALVTGFLTAIASQRATTVLITNTDTVTTATTTYSNFTTTFIAGCTIVNGISCLGSRNQTLSLNIEYDGPWGVTYKVYFGLGTTGPVIETGHFYGTNSTKLNIVTPAPTNNGIDTCVIAQKLDGSTSTLAIASPNSSSGNQTSIPFGSTRFCEISIIP